LIRYKCRTCQKQFQSTKKKSNKNLLIYQNYVIGKQTLSQLCSSLKISKPTLVKQFDKLTLPVFDPKPREIILILDATYFGKKKDKDGLLIGKDWITKEIVYFDFIQTENKEVFLKCKNDLEYKGFKIIALVVDGRVGIKDIFKGVLIQMCQFHQVQIINRYLTKKPKLTPSKQLKTIIESLTRSSYKSFQTRFSYWLEINQDFLNEKTTNPKTNKKQYTHKRLRSAVKSVQNNLPYLFTYQDKQFIEIEEKLISEYLKHGMKPPSKTPNTTNTLDGWFNHLKKLLRCHQGLKKGRKHKMIEMIVISSGFS
jgi:hypothetical protein